MPTPSSDEAIIPPTAISIDEDIRRCPPDEGRERHAPREERVAAATQPGAAEDVIVSQRDTRAGTQVPTPEPESGSSTLDSLQSDQATKGEHVEEAGLTPEPWSPAATSPEAPSDNDARLAHTMSSTAISPGHDGASCPLYLDYPEMAQGRQIGIHSTTSYLRPGSRFRGTQQSDRQVYDVQVELKDVNLEESRLCGYLRIQGT